jgi:hypothetical protein
MLPHTSTRCLHKIDHSCKAEYSTQDISARTRTHTHTHTSSLKLGNALVSPMFALVQQLYSERVDSSLLKAALGSPVDYVEHDVESSDYSVLCATLLPLDLRNQEQLRIKFVMVLRTREIRVCR